MKKLSPSSAWLASAALGVFVLAPLTQAVASGLDTLVVTASRTPQTVNQSLASVTVITREEIERLQAHSLVDLLRSRAGIDINSNGAFGKTTGLSSRGTNSNHTLLLVDGVRMGSASSGGASWQYLPASEIDRVEIVRGPRTSLYGSDAIGGVIQVFTRRGQTGEPKLNAFAGAGSFGTQKAGASVAGGTESLLYSLGVSRFDTDGIDARNTGSDDKDGYDNTSFSGNLEYRLSQATRFTTSLLHSSGNSEYDPGADDYQEFVHSAVRAAWQQQWTNQWSSELAVAQSRDESEAFDSWPGYFNTRMDQLSWINTLQLGIHHIQLGVDALKEQLDSSTDYNEASRNNLGVFAQMQVPYGQLSSEFSLRFDDNEQFGNKTTGQVGLGYWVSPDLSLRSSAGTAFVVPTFNQLYWPADPVWGGGGNPDLKPEQSISYELGAHYAQDGWFVDLAVFHTEIEDLIAGFPADNVNEARIQGIEAEAGWRLDGFSVAAAATLLKPEDRETGKDLRRRARQTLRVDMDQQWQSISAGLSIINRGKSYDNATNTTEIDGYTLLNLRTAWQINKAFSLQASIENALDKEYTTAVDYKEPGRAGYLTLVYQQ